MDEEPPHGNATANSIIIIIIITSETGITIYNYKSHRKLVNVKGLKKNRLVCINIFPNIFVMNSRLDL